MNEILTEKEVAEILACEVTTVQEKARTGELPAVKFGRSWVFPRAALVDRICKLAIERKPFTPERRGISKTPMTKRPPTLPQPG